MPSRDVTAIPSPKSAKRAPGMDQGPPLGAGVLAASSLRHG